MHSIAFPHPGLTPISLPFSFGGHVSSLISRIYQLTVQHFSLLQNSCVAGFGVKEILIDFPLQCTKGNAIVEKVVGSHFNKIKEINKEFSLVHGILYLGSGVCGGLESADSLQWVHLGTALPFVKFAAAGLFLFANLFSLTENIRLYYHADQLDKKDEVLANKIKISSVLGILNNIGYILATIAYFVPAADFVYYALAVFSVLAGSIKIIYDFFVLTPALKRQMDS